MIRTVVGLCAAAWLLISGVAHAQTPPCKTQGDPAARGVAYSQPAPLMLASMTAPGAVLKSDLAGLAAKPLSCERATFAVGSQTFILGGENGEPVARRVTPEAGAGPSVLLIDLTQGYGAAPSSQTPPLALVGLDAKGSALYALFDKPPPDALMLSISKGIFGGNLRPMFLVDGKTGQLTINIPSPPAGAASQSGRSAAPDGVIFVDNGNGAARHVATGFVCPAQVGGIQRIELVVFDQSERGRDVGCGYGAREDGTWHSIYLTKLPSTSPEQYLKASIDDALGLTPRIGDYSLPIATGAPPQPSHTYFWKSPRGGEALLIRKVGDWFLTVRTTIKPGDEEKATQTMRDLLQLFSTFGVQPV